MLTLLTLSLASADQVNTDGLLLTDQTETTNAERSLIEAATQCCMSVDTTLPDQVMIPVSQREGIFRMSLGHTRQGQIDYLGGTALSSQLVAIDDVPMIISGLAGMIYTRTGTDVARHNTRPLPPRYQTVW
ncbi:MAG: hypothetical protein ACI8RZ_005681 [Myxococcota bacterium]|jgi:hypothetical protein